MNRMNKIFSLGPLLALLILGGCQTTPSSHDLHSPAGPVISAIETDIAANRLTRPTGNNAMEKIERLALIAPGDPRIETYKNDVVQQLVNLGQQAFLDGKNDQAKVLAFRALKIEPDNADAGYILDAVRESERPLSVRTQESKKVRIEEVETPSSVGITTVDIPDIQNTVIETSARKVEPQ